MPLLCQKFGIGSRWLSLPLSTLVAFVGVSYVNGAEPAPPAPPPVSKYAPAVDLIALAKGYAESFPASVSDAQKYSKDQPKVQKDAHTLAVVALALALSDEDHALKKVSPALMGAAQALAAAKEAGAAKTAADSITALIAETGEAGDVQAPAEWQKVARMGPLMKQVTFVHNRLKRGLQKNRFEQTAADTAQYAAVLAIIGQACNVDTHEVKDPADIDKWYQYCAEMRDAAGEVNGAIHAKNFDGATAGLEKLEKSCQGCHEVFRAELVQ